MRLIDYIPTYYKKSRFVKALFAAYENMLNRLREKAAQTRKNIFVLTASERLDLHEKDVCLSVSADSDEVRRARILSRLRGWNTVTNDEIVRLVETYGFSGAGVEEHFSEYMFTIHANAKQTTIFDDMRNAVEKIKPAHLGMKYSVVCTPSECDYYYAMPAIQHTEYEFSSPNYGRLDVTPVKDFVLI